MMEARKLAEVCAQRCLEKKGENVVILNLESKSSVADYFVVCSGFSDRQVSAIADFISAEGRNAGIKVYNEEGMKEGRWALIDFGTVIVHVFQDHLRDYYNLEGLWQDAPRIHWQDETDSIARPSDFEPGSARF
ncbi:MAG TPA: ribosome silencing factor [Bdellovibrionota bacterium]|jgi:ribosome-associated protein